MFNNIFNIKKLRILVVSLMTLGFTLNAYSMVYYVKAGAPNGGNGTSWSKAFNNLDSALIASSSSGPNQIWVAAGTYKPSIQYAGTYSGTEANLKTFKLPSNVAIYGGFNGTEKLLGQRNLNTNPTILSGDLNGDDINDPNNLMTNKTDNAWHVLTADNATNVILDSLIVRNGYASGPDAGTVDRQLNIVTLDYAHNAGGGLLAHQGSQITLNNMRFEYNATDRVRATLINPNLPGSPALASGGGALAVLGLGSSVTIKNSTFEYNSATKVGGNGGAINAENEGTLTVIASTFANNTADRTGGAIRFKNSALSTVKLSSFSQNSIVGNTIGDESGGAIGIINSNIDINSSVFDSNSSSLTAGGGAIFFHTPFKSDEPYSLNVTNSIFKNNLGGIFGGGAINVSGFKPFPGTQATITSNIFSNNSAGQGGAVFTDSIPTVISNSGFYNNEAFENGGAILGTNFGDALFGTGDLTTRSELQIKNSLFVANSSLGEPSIQPVIDFFASVLAQVFRLPPATVTLLSPGGGAIAAEMGGNLTLINNAFLFNNATNGNGGALLVGGSAGISGPAQAAENGLNQAYVNMSKSFCYGNTASLGGNNTSVLDPAGLGPIPNGVELLSDGSCP